jgi:hypothetical protein
MKHHLFTTPEEVLYADKLLKDGVLIASRKDGFCNVYLYQTGAMYLEVYRHAHFNVIIKVNSFMDTAHLEPYIENIDLTELSL